MDIPIGIQAADYDSVRSKGNLVNMLAEVNKDGSYLAVRRCYGLKEIHSIGTSPIRSNILVNSGYMYFVMGANFYRADESSYDLLGVVNGIGQAEIVPNSIPGNNQLCVLNGSGAGYIYDNSGLNQITDPDFYSTTSVTILNERFWFSRDGTNEIFASDQSDGAAYSPLSFATAEWKPDDVVGVVSIKSILWVIGERTMEYWQSFSNSTVPIRAVKSASTMVGCKVKATIAQLDEAFAFLADDGSVQLVLEDGIQRISDLDFEKKVFGDGTDINPGFSTDSISKAIGFWVEQPSQKIYYITFPDEGYTWGYDMMTGLAHTRSSYDVGAWRALYSTNFANKIYVGDRVTGKIYQLTPEKNEEVAQIMKASMTTPGISFKRHVTIPWIQVDMEVGQSENPTETPVVMCKYSKDGGYSWTNHQDISVGNTGDHRRLVILRNFGRLVKGKEIMFELSTSDDVRFVVYAIEGSVEDLE